MEFIEGIGRNTIAADYTNKKHGPGRRLYFALLATLILIALYAWMGVQIASRAGLFIPGN